MDTDRFSRTHPAVSFGFFLAVILLSVMLLHPVYLTLSLAGAAAYLLRSNVVLLVLAAVGSTTLPVRVFNAVESRLGDKAAVALRSVGVAILLLLSVAFLVGDSYNPFLYFRF